jgi:hypothetical protein
MVVLHFFEIPPPFIDISRIAQDLEKLMKGLEKPLQEKEDPPWDSEYWTRWG